MTTNKVRPRDLASNVRLHPLTPEQAITGMFKIGKADVKRITASKPKKTKGQKK